MLYLAPPKTYAYPWEALGVIIFIFPYPDYSTETPDNQDADCYNTSQSSHGEWTAPAVGRTGGACLILSRLADLIAQTESDEKDKTFCMSAFLLLVCWLVCLFLV